MPAKDYEAEKERYKKAFYSNRKINPKHKDLVKKYISCKENSVSPARLGIIFRFLPYFLEKINDVKKDMRHRDKINEVFNKIRKQVSPSIFNTVINVSKTFCRFYNDEETPKGFKGIKTDSKSDKRKLNPADMVTWEDALKLISLTKDVQLQAIIATQLDGGFRPSEFVDLNYGDLELHKDIILVYVRDGKTGPRPVQLYHANPFIHRWINAHPTKKKNDSLWLQSDGDKWVKYDFHAMDMRVRRLSKLAKLEKPFDFYNLRHSACVLAKKDNLPTDLAAAKFGHSVKFFTETYGRLSVDDNIKRMRKHFGMVEDEEKKENNQICPKCSLINQPNSTHCEKCQSPLTLGQALKEREDSLKLGEKMEQMEKSMAEIRESMAQELAKRIVEKTK